MPGEIVYSLIARGDVVFAEHTSSTGNFQQVTRTILEKLADQQEGKLSYAYDNYIFHLSVEGGIIYLCMATVDFHKKAAFNFLSAVTEQFKSTYAQGVIDRAAAYELNGFSEVLQSRMEYWTANPEDKVDRIKGEVDEVRTIMVDNISAILDRGDKIELLVDKAEDLGEQANKFRKSGSQLKSKMWWSQLKLQAIICGGVSVRSPLEIFDKIRLFYLNPLLRFSGCHLHSNIDGLQMLWQLLRHGRGEHSRNRLWSLHGSDYSHL